MAMAAGSRLGPYEILASLGAGGMGEVYRARDSRLGRDVAIKVLPSSFSQDADRLRRFEQEARAAGVLNHPNITAVYDVGAVDGAPYVVQELLEGETLRSALAGGRLSTRRATDYALQIAHGLGAAHDKGIVHRDLKPENVFVTNDGRVKILDFGLAKLTQPDSGGAPQTSLPTATAGTEPGVVLGTLGYMSPEQVRGRPADARSDIFSFGAILYEMLSGKRAFAGDSAADTMSAILKEDPPDLSISNQSISPGLERIVRHCLEKSPEQRFQAARDVAFAIESLSVPSGPVARADEGGRRRIRLARPIAAAGLLLGGLAIGLILSSRVLSRPIPQPPSLRYITSSGDDWAPSASPDGKTIAFVSDRDGRRRVWLKQIEQGSEVALTEGQDDNPRFSPDGSTVLFERIEAERRSIYRHPILGGESRRVVEGAWGGDWSPDGGRITYVRLGAGQGAEAPVRTDRVRSAAATIVVAQSDGSEPKTVADFSPLIVESPPRWSPDGRWIALALTRPASTVVPQIVLVSSDGKRRRTLAPARKARVGVLEWNGSGGELLYAQPESLDYSQVAAAGSVFVQNVETGHSRTLLSLPRATSTLSVVGEGHLALDLSAARQTLRELPIGSPLGSARVLTGGSTADRQPAYAPDGEWVVFSGSREGHFALWKVSAKTGAMRRLTYGPSSDWDPAYADGGRRILFSSNRSGVFEIWIADAEGGGARQVTRDGVDAENPTATPDLSWITYTAGGGRGLWKIHPDGTGAALVTSGDGAHAEISPDGAWVLLFDQAEKRFALKVVALADGRPAPFLIDRLADGRARWMPDGRSIVFRDRDANGRWALFQQDFAPGRDTRATRRLLVSSPSETEEIETFGISPDGTRLVAAVVEWQSGILLSEGIRGIAPRRSAP